MDTVKEKMKEKSLVPEADDSHIPKALQPKPQPMLVSARLKANANNPFRGPMSSRRKPADNDPDVLFLAQQKLAPWRPVRYKRFVPSDAFENRIPLLYPYEDSELTEQSAFGPRQDEYTASLLAALMPTTKILPHGHAELPKTSTLEEIVQTIMMKAHVIRFNKLIECARERSPDPHLVTNTAILQYVQKVACLVRGWWVVKSELLYPPTTYSEHGSVSSTLLTRARDYIMAVFHRGEHLTRKTISSMTKLPALEATQILQHLAHKMAPTQRGLANHWEFHSPDHEFMRRYPDIVQQQKAAWEARIRQLCVQLKLEYLVSDGVRRKRRTSGRLSSESGSENEHELVSLISGVSASGSASKRMAQSKRKRQLSLSSEPRSVDRSSSGTKPPPAKRTRTQSASVTSAGYPLSPPPSTTVLTGISVASNGPTSNAPLFTPPASPPLVKYSTTMANAGRTPQLRQNCNVTREPERVAPSTPRSKQLSDSPISTPDSSKPGPNCKPEPSSPPPPRVTHEPAVSTTAEDVKPDIASLPVREPTDQAGTGSPVVETANCSAPEAPSDPLLTFVEEKMRSQPIVGLSELAKMVQDNFCGTHDLYRILPIDTNLRPPPGSEAERELLKTHLLDTLSRADARQININWPNVPYKLPEEPLFTRIVAGNECGAVSEPLQKLRDAILDCIEKLPGFKWKDLQDRLQELSVATIPRKMICAMLKQLCIFKRSRYFLRQTVSE